LEGEIQIGKTLVKRFRFPAT